MLLHRKFEFRRRCLKLNKCQVKRIDHVPSKNKEFFPLKILHLDDFCVFKEVSLAQTVCHFQLICVGNLFKRN